METWSTTGFIEPLSSNLQQLACATFCGQFTWWWTQQQSCRSIFRRFFQWVHTYTKMVMCLYLWICFVELAYPSCFQSLSVWSSARYGYGEARAEMFIPRDEPMVWNLICPTKLAVNFGIPRFWRKPRWNWNILKPPNQFDRTTPWPAVLPHRPSAPPTGASLSLQHFHLLGGSYDPIWSNPTWTRKGGKCLSVLDHCWYVNDSQKAIRSVKLVGLIPTKALHLDPIKRKVLSLRTPTWHGDESLQHPVAGASMSFSSWPPPCKPQTWKSCFQLLLHWVFSFLSLKCYDVLPIWIGPNTTQVPKVVPQRSAGNVLGSRCDWSESWCHIYPSTWVCLNMMRTNLMVHHHFQNIFLRCTYPIFGHNMTQTNITWLVPYTILFPLCAWSTPIV